MVAVVGRSCYESLLPNRFFASRLHPGAGQSAIDFPKDGWRSMYFPEPAIWL